MLSVRPCGARALRTLAIGARHRRQRPRSQRRQSLAIMFRNGTAPKMGGEGVGRGGVQNSSLMEGHWWRVYPPPVVAVFARVLYKLLRSTFSHNHAHTFTRHTGHRTGTRHRRTPRRSHPRPETHKQASQEDHTASIAPPQPRLARQTHPHQRPPHTARQTPRSPARSRVQ